MNNLADDCCNQGFRGLALELQKLGDAHTWLSAGMRLE